MPPDSISISQIDTPLSGTVLTFLKQGDFLALVLEFVTSDVISSVLEIDNDLIGRITSGKLTEQEMALSDRALLASVHRLSRTPSAWGRSNAKNDCGSPRLED